MNIAAARLKPDLSSAFEVKFLIDEPTARSVEEWARRSLAPDPHGIDGVYETTSLYCDTPEFSIYFRTPSYYRRRKFRIRRYASGTLAYLERKTRWGDRVAKLRTTIALDELPRLASAESTPTWDGYSFHRRLKGRRLGPSCHIVYTRTAFVGDCPESPLRLTLDRKVQGIPTAQWTLALPGAAKPLLKDQVILELKYRAALPAPFKKLMADVKLIPGSISKYRLCWEAWGGPTAHA